MGYAVHLYYNIYFEPVHTWDPFHQYGLTLVPA